MHPHRPLLLFLAKYKYQVLLPLAVVEGPLVTVIAGILVARGQLSFLPTLAIVFAGDLISDPALYLVGRFGRHLLRKLAFIKGLEERLDRVERRYATHPLQTMIVGKLSYGLGSLFVVAAGAARMPARRFALYMGLVDATKSSLLLVLGYFFGRAILPLSGYLQYYAFAVVSVLGGWLILELRKKAP